MGEDTGRWDFQLCHSGHQTEKKCPHDCALCTWHDHDTAPSEPSLRIHTYIYVCYTNLSELLRSLIPWEAIFIVECYGESFTMPWHTATNASVFLTHRIALMFGFKFISSIHPRRFKVQKRERGKFWYFKLCHHWSLSCDRSFRNIFIDDQNTPISL